MVLTRVERERLRDSQMKIQAVTKTLKHIDPKKVPDLTDIEKCLLDANRSLTGALRESQSER